MVEYRKPPELSEHIIDLRVRRSPRGSIPLSAAAMLKRKQEQLIREQDEEFRRQQAATWGAAVKRRYNTRLTRG